VSQTSEGIGKALATAIKDDAVPARERRGTHIFQNSRRREIFTLLTTSPCLGTSELAARCGLAKNSVEWHIKTLIVSGYVVRHDAGRACAYYPEGLISHDRAIMFGIINTPRLGSLFRLAVTSPGLSQSEMARSAGKSRQWVARGLGVLESAGLLNAVADGSNSRYYPTRLLPDMAEEFYGHSREFTEYIIRRLAKEGGSPPTVTKKGLDRVLVEMGYQTRRFSMEIGINPYLTCLGC
jgi:predicted transcriptional regulator